MTDKTIVQPTVANLLKCSINGVDHFSVSGVNFHVKELRMFEDICKPYFTGQLVIETMQNGYEYLIGPTVPVILSFEALRSDNGPTKVYTEKLRIFSYDSKPISGGADGRIEHTLSLIGQEYYNDQHNTVMQGFSQIPGTSAASQIHGQYMAVNGGLKNLITSTGLIGSKEVPHQSLNVKPVKAIHDILDRSVYSQYKTGAPVYFRDKNGYVMAPLQHLLESGGTVQSFKHQLAQGIDMKDLFFGYENVIHMRPLSPPGEAGATASGAISSMLNSSQFYDNKTGNTESIKGNLSAILKNPIINKIPGMKARVQQMLSEASRGTYGGRNMFHIINDFMQSRSVAKHGPGGYDKAEEAFLTTLTYAQKYWISVPLQSGLNCTCGKRIKVAFPIVGTMVERTFFIPRLIHELRFTEGKDRKTVANIGTTDIYCVDW